MSPSYEAAIRVIIDARTRLNVSQRALAERLGKHRSFVSKVENRERRLDFVEFVAWSRALGMDAEALMATVAATLPDKLEF
jgi:transcriptional regulator with XRE-family HTH domain